MQLQIRLWTNTTSHDCIQIVCWASVTLSSHNKNTHHRCTLQIEPSQEEYPPLLHSAKRIVSTWQCTCTYTFEQTPQAMTAFRLCVGHISHFLPTRRIPTIAALCKQDHLNEAVHALQMFMKSWAPLHMTIAYTVLHYKENLTPGQAYTRLWILKSIWICICNFVFYLYFKKEYFNVLFVFVFCNFVF